MESLLSDYYRVAPEADPVLTYQYPYFSGQAHDFNARASVSSPDCLPEPLRGPDGMYRRPGFDVTEAAFAADGPVVEIGGPTPAGYACLRDGRLPSRPHIINIVSRLNQEMPTPIDGVGLSVNQVADVRSLPIPDASIGVMMASGIDPIDVEPFNKLQREGLATPQQDREAKLAAIRQVDAQTELALAHRNPAELPFATSPRMATIMQAARTLKPGGIFIFRGADTRNIRVATMLGLQVAMHSPPQASSFDPTCPRIGEVVFQKPGQP